MRGEKNEQTRAAVEYCLDRLHDGDGFNVITFGTEVRAFRGQVAAKTAENVAAAKTFLEDTVAAGRTNISEALAKGLAGTTAAGRGRIMIFLTDGAPTAGELRPEEILKQVAEVNKNGTRVFVIGVGHDVNVHLLDKLAQAGEGSAEYVRPEEEIDVKVAALFNRVSFPVMADVQLSFDGLPVNSVYPKKVPAVFRESQIMVSGRYREGGRKTVTLSGTLHGKPVQYSCQAEFPAQDEPRHEFVATLWAARTIGFLLQEIRLKGENKELVEEVVRLSRRYGIVTEYTAFLATAESASLSNKEVAERARALMNRANGEQAGKWAFNQAGNEGALQGRMVAAPSVNNVLDRNGNVQDAQNLKHSGRRVFYQREGRWVEAEEAGDRKKRSVKLLSPEYLELVRQNADFAKAQEVGGEMELNVGNERIQVEK